MKCRTTRQIEHYEQGSVNAEWVATLIVEETTTRPTAAFVATIPAAITGLIRTKTAAPLTTEWIIFGGGDRERWLAGLTLWREYFTLEEHH